MRRRWSNLAGGLTRWQSRYGRPAEEGAGLILTAGAKRGLTASADAYLDALQETCRQDEHAFGLQAAACEAGERLAEAMTTLAASGPNGFVAEAGAVFERPKEAFVAELTRAVAGDGGTLADAAVRRAATRAGRVLVEEHPQAIAPCPSGEGASKGGGLVGEVLCLLFRTFFAELVAEFLRAVIAEKITLAVPVLALDLSPDPFAERVAASVVELIPDPCEEYAEHGEAVSGVLAETEGEEQSALPGVARRLVPRTVRAVLGLSQGDEEEVAA